MKVNAGVFTNLLLFLEVTVLITPLSHKYEMHIHREIGRGKADITRRHE